jgi:hypothetical protein
VTHWVGVGELVTVADADTAFHRHLTVDGPDVIAKPFQLSESALVPAALPIGTDAARLVISFVVDGAVTAAAVLDVHRR